MSIVGLSLKAASGHQEKMPRLVGRIGVPEKSLENVQKTALLNLLSKMKVVLQLLVHYSSFVDSLVLKIRDLLLLILLILKSVYVSVLMLSGCVGMGRSLRTLLLATFISNCMAGIVLRLLC